MIQNRAIHSNRAHPKMSVQRCLAAAIILVSVLVGPTLCNFKGIEREKCDSRIGMPFRPHSEQRHYVRALRDEMKMRSSVQGSHIDAYIVTNWDEHLNVDIGDFDKRLQFISGFTGKIGLVVITLKSVALWTDERYFNQANHELNCDWKIFSINNGTSLTDLLVSELPQAARVGGDPHTVPHKVWMQWESALYVKYIRVIRLNQNLVDCVWKNRPEPNINAVQVQPLAYAGETWQSRVHTLRDRLIADRCDAIVITSLTEIAYLLNLRGDDVPYTPVFKAYLVVSLTDTYLYVNKAKIDVGITLHLESHQCSSEKCVQVKNYDEIWIDLRSYSHIWRKVLVPSHCAYDLGVSEAVFSSIIRNVILEKPSPVIFMRAKKNAVEREGMQRAHVLDGAALCDAFSLLERRYLNSETITEMSAADDVDRSRYSMKSNRGIAFKTIVAFGAHSALPHYETLNDTNVLLADTEPCIIDSGGQYAEGTAEATRTLHFGEPTFQQKQMYTNVLRGIIRLSTLIFPENLKPAEIDALARSPVWDSHSDYPQSTGHGIGSFLSVREPSIDVSSTESHKFTFEEGYFFSNEPGLYSKGRYGIRLKNVLEVYDTDTRHPSGARFLGFRDISLVPFEPTMIDRAMLSLQEKQWLNEYNARIRTLVGEELKSQSNMQAFYWMINKTTHIIEYFPESEYRKRNAANSPVTSHWLCAFAIVYLAVYATIP